MDVVALIFPLVLLIVAVGAVVVVRREFRRWIWGDDGPDRGRRRQRRR